MLSRPSQPQDKLSVAGLENWHVQEFLYNHLRNANLHQPGIVNDKARDLRFSSNEHFWKNVLDPENEELKRIGLRWVELRGFQLTDWFPRTPGLYHTSYAEGARELAELYVNEDNEIRFYEPRGKYHMMEGGIGSVRLKPISIKDTDFWMCTATSDNNCHSGIPIAVPDELMYEVDFHSSCKITGQVRFLPEFLEHHFIHMSQIPQIYIEVDNITRWGNEKKPSVKITPMIFFSTERGMDLYLKEYVTYVTCHADSIEELNGAIERLVWYVDMYNGEIITNFDQQQPTFANAPFSLQNVMSSKLNARVLERYHIENANIVCDRIESLHAEALNMTKIKVNLGDGTTIHGDFVVANSIKDSFNKAEKADVPNELKDTLKELAKAVAVMSEKLPADTAQQVARDLETLTSEVTSKSPRKQWWQLSVEGLAKAAKDMGDIGKPVLELAAKIVAILSVL